MRTDGCLTRFAVDRKRFPFIYLWSRLEADELCIFCLLKKRFDSTASEDVEDDEYSQCRVFIISTFCHREALSVKQWFCRSFMFLFSLKTAAVKMTHGTGPGGTTS